MSKDAEWHAVVARLRKAFPTKWHPDTKEWIVGQVVERGGLR